MGRKNLNLGNLLVLAGVGGLGFSFWLPYGTANRVYRIEHRAAVNTQRFVDAAKKRAKIDWQDKGVRAAILDEVNAAGGHQNGDSSRHLRALDTDVLAGRAFLFEGKHYYYLITNTPRAVLGLGKPIERPKDGEDPKKEDPLVPVVPVPPGEEPVKVPLPAEEPLPYEAYAWPREQGTSTRTVFFVPSDAAAAFTRNLSERYFGLRRKVLRSGRKLGGPPQPGNGRYDIENESREKSYRGIDDERWLYQVVEAAAKK